MRTEQSRTSGFPLVSDAGQEGKRLVRVGGRDPAHASGDSAGGRCADSIRTPVPVHYRILRRDTIVRTPIRETFAFFADAGNLDLLTPDWLRFRVLTPLPIEVRAGTTLEYRIRLFGVPFFWRTRIAEWRPPHGFVDFQERGPYRWWRHSHSFEVSGDGTRVSDLVEYAAPIPWVSGPLLVTRSLRRIFDYRQDRLRAILGGG